MPLPKKNAPAGRVYKSANPLQQAKLPVPKKRIKSYGKQTPRRRTKDEDNTLTQIGFIQLRENFNGDNEEENEIEDGPEVEEDSDYEVAVKKRRTKRRKTEGDKPEIRVDFDYERKSTKTKKMSWKSEGDKPSSTAQWHTQTLTQMPSFSSNDPEDEAAENTKEDQLAQRARKAPLKEKSLWDVPSSSPSMQLPVKAHKLSGPAKPNLKRNQRGSAGATGKQPSPISEMPPPQTPRKITRQEIPSSQSPATPFSLPSRSSLPRSPLKELSMNAPIPFNANPKSAKNSDKPPKLVIEDTFESGNRTLQSSDPPSSPPKRSSPAKIVRFATLPVDDEEGKDEPPPSPFIQKESTPHPARTSSGSINKLEIMDSDDEDDEFTPVQHEDEEMDISREEIMIKEEKATQAPQVQEEQETCYGDIGHETQIAADRVISSLSEPSPVENVLEESNEEQEEIGYVILGTNEEIAEDDEEEYQNEGVVTGETQMGGTQRLSTQHVGLMDPRTEGSDIFISIHPKHVTNIVSRAKNHEFRNWNFPITVKRLWIYETKPVCTLKYMAEISAAKSPGEITDLKGIGNADFNTKPRNKHWKAYEILQLYELGDPVPLARLISNGWMKAAPQKFSWVRPAVADELVSNLKPPLFNSEEVDRPSLSLTDTQEASDQLASTIKQFEQPPAPEQRVPSSPPVLKSGLMILPAPTPRHDNLREQISVLHPSQATTVDLTQAASVRLSPLDLDEIEDEEEQPITRRRRRRVMQEEDEPIQIKTEDATQIRQMLPPPLAPMDTEDEEEIVHESPTRPVLSSTPLKLTTPKSTHSDNQQDSMVPYSMSSSQFLSKSQLLPDSLLNEDMPGPPLFIHDTDEEEDEL